MDAATMLVTLTAEDLTRIIERAIDERIAPLREAISKGEELPELMTRRQVAEYLAITVQTVDNFTRQGLLKKHYLNGLPRFKRDEVRAAAAAYQRYGRD
jgi:hypothetical protein